MKKEDFEKYKMYLSYEDLLHKLQLEINKTVPLQIFDGSSEIGYMTEELKELRKNLFSIIDKNKEMIQTKKEEL